MDMEDSESIIPEITEIPNETIVTESGAMRMPQVSVSIGGNTTALDYDVYWASRRGGLPSVQLSFESNDDSVVIDISPDGAACLAEQLLKATEETRFRSLEGYQAEQTPLATFIHDWKRLIAMSSEEQTLEMLQSEDYRAFKEEMEKIEGLSSEGTDDGADYLSSDGD